MRNFLATRAKNELQLSFLLVKKENCLGLYFNTRYGKKGKWVGSKGNPGNPRRQGPPLRLRAAGVRNTGFRATEEDSRPPLLPTLLTPPSKPTIACLVTSPIYTYRKSSPAKTPHTASTCCRYYRSVFKLHIYQGCNVTLKNAPEAHELKLPNQPCPPPFASLWPGQWLSTQEGHHARAPCTQQ